ncbi:inositol -trisphosphate receptor, putative [Ichthyophthirius multifiliis]|uniref:Inositol-trisphosphate receptor, putative n=1 Tax=Ichthyophthirius multifiliis TaxID=5932 RepID=G0R2L6_ICHMU|nr:inositol -trisphosphate receptor, putative [Ichthyophthirius multifiliis]EGR28280.1 inositol -trisphosphate receptor, putative [Ichthyophthirius multifiliis]|eukprot:XP_004027625.1 inositol -trisphosphate receptor, putative [Ichthyophthirius multifiliis]
MIIVYIYSISAYFSNDLKNSFQFNGNNNNLQVCGNKLDCFLLFLNLGLRNGGGIGESFDQVYPGQNQYYGRFIFELSFFLVIIVIWLNIIFGIIIDTFAELRDIKYFKDNDSKNKCFICNQDRADFYNLGINFQKHIEKEHHLWNYLAFIIMIKQKEINDLDGTEYFIRNNLDTQNISWFPIGKSISIQNMMQKEDQIKKIK